MLREEEKERSKKKKGPTTDRERDRQFLVRLIYIFRFPLALLQEAQVCGRVLLRMLYWKPESRAENRWHLL